MIFKKIIAYLKRFSYLRSFGLFGKEPAAQKLRLAGLREPRDQRLKLDGIRETRSHLGSRRGINSRTSFEKRVERRPEGHQSVRICYAADDSKNPRDVVAGQKSSVPA